MFLKNVGRNFWYKTERLFVAYAWLLLIDLKLW